MVNRIQSLNKILNKRVKIRRRLILIKRVLIDHCMMGKKIVMNMKVLMIFMTT